MLCNADKYVFVANVCLRHTFYSSLFILMHTCCTVSYCSSTDNVSYTDRHGSLCLFVFKPLICEGMN